MSYRGFALACWKERYLYITGGFTAGKQENNYVSELDLVELDAFKDLPEMNVDRNSHSSFDGGDTLVVLCGFSFEQ